MNLNYAIFRSEPIYTINDLAQIGSHNKREKQAYKSNIIIVGTASLLTTIRLVNQLLAQQKQAESVKQKA